MTAALFQSGRFTARDTDFAWGILAAASLGLLATSLARLYSSAFYALHDTKSPLRMALARVAVAAGLGVLAAVYAPRVLGIDSRWGAAGLALASSVAGWVEFLLLRQRLNHRIGRTGLDAGFIVRLLAAAIIAGAAGYGAKLIVPDAHRFIVAGASLASFGIVYLGLTYAFGISESAGLIRRLRRAR
jgi:putative peptidoglycan lipid II flippase